MNKKAVMLLMALVLIVGIAVGTTVAWLSAKTDDVKNTFTPSDIDITLEETTGEEYKMVPGTELEKDPLVTVKAGSEYCWVFVKVDESDNFDDFMEYAIDTDNWELVSGTTDVYCYIGDAMNLDDPDVSQTLGSDLELSVLAGDKVTVLDSVTKDMLTAADFEEPTLTFTAYAIQKLKFDSAAAAWAEAQKLGGSSSTT